MLEGGVGGEIREVGGASSLGICGLQVRSLNWGLCWRVVSVELM